MKIAFIGGGNMARSIIGGISTVDFSPMISVCDINKNTLKALQADFAVEATTEIKLAVDKADIVIIAVKPQVAKSVAVQLSEFLPSKCLIISIVAGLLSTNLKKWLNTDLAIIRVMPNTPALVQCGLSAIFTDSPLRAKEQQAVEQIFSVIGEIVWLQKESDLNAITAISGSGPAYFFALFAAVEQMAERLGIDENLASFLIKQTALGAATMALQSQESSVKLQQNVSSKGGTTEKALEVLTEQRWQQNLQTAIMAAYQRSIELGGSKEE